MWMKALNQGFYFEMEDGNEGDYDSCSEDSSITL